MTIGNRTQLTGLTRQAPQASPAFAPAANPGGFYAKLLPGSEIDLRDGTKRVINKSGQAGNRIGRVFIVENQDGSLSCELKEYPGFAVFAAALLNKVADIHDRQVEMLDKAKKAKANKGLIAALERSLNTPIYDLDARLDGENLVPVPGVSPILDGYLGGCRVCQTARVTNRSCSLLFKIADNTVIEGAAPNQVIEIDGMKMEIATGQDGSTKISHPWIVAQLINMFDAATPQERRHEQPQLFGRDEITY
jgi:hypothetical protein